MNTRTPAEEVERDVTRKMDQSSEKFVDAARSMIRSLKEQIENVEAGYGPRNPLGGDVTRLHDAAEAWRLHNDMLMTIRWMNSQVETP